MHYVSWICKGRNIPAREANLGFKANNMKRLEVGRLWTLRVTPL